MAGFIAKGVGFNVDESARSDERDSEGAPLRRGDVYIANVPLVIYCKKGEVAF